MIVIVQGTSLGEKMGKSDFLKKMFTWTLDYKEVQGRRNHENLCLHCRVCKTHILNLYCD